MPDHSTTPFGFCQCGCGQLAPVATKTSSARGHVKGEPLRYIYGHGGGRKKMDTDEKRRRKNERKKRRYAGNTEHAREINRASYHRRFAQGYRTHRNGYSRANPETVRAYRDTHREEIAASKLAGIARQRGATVVELVYRSVLFERDHGLCYICHEPVDSAHWHIDHIVPVSAGGDHTYANTAVSHPRCNQSKYTSRVVYVTA